jgi:serine/threonine protein kinase
MPAPATIDDFLEVVRRSNQIDTGRLEACLSSQLSRGELPDQPQKLAAMLIREGLLTNFQAEQFLQGRWKGFILGGYRIIERLGQGGSGAVYLAAHEVMRRQVAIKVLPPAFAREAGVVERFQREAQAVAALDHPNIVRAYDFRQENNIYFLVMEYVEGISLQELMATRGRLPLGQAADYIRQAALGLQHAHEAGLIHRDIKPANLLVDQRGLVKVADLGLARQVDPNGQSLTEKIDEGVVMGTADYLAPEQALNVRDIDARVDQYALGATLYALLVGEAPFEAGTVTQKLLWHQMRDPRPVEQIRPEVPRELGAVIRRMMAKRPGDRYVDAAEVAEMLLPWAEGPWPPGPGEKPAGLREDPTGRIGATRSMHPARNGGSGRLIVVMPAQQDLPVVEPAPETAITRLRTRDPEPAERAKRQPNVALPLRTARARFWMAILCGSLLPILAIAGVALALVLCFYDSPRPPVERVVPPSDEGGSRPIETPVVIHQDVPHMKVQEFLVVGPFGDNLAEVQPPEENPDPAAEYDGKKWKLAQANTAGYLDLRAIFAADYVSVYAMTFVHSPRPQKVPMWLGSDDGVRVWVNGKLVHEVERNRKATANEDKVNVELNQGWNKVLVKVINVTGPHGLYLRFNGTGYRISRTPTGK